jgi:hypothetical protein
MRHFTTKTSSKLQRQWEISHRTAREGGGSIGEKTVSIPALHRRFCKVIEIKVCGSSLILALHNLSNTEVKNISSSTKNCDSLGHKP